MRSTRWILVLSAVALVVGAQACGQPDQEVGTATSEPSAAAPTATEMAPTAEPTATAQPTEEPSATAEPTAEPDTPTPPPTEEVEPTPTPAQAEGRALLEERCTVCHTLDRVERSQKSREEWESTVERMRGRGAQLTDDETELLLDYLAATYGS